MSKENQPYPIEDFDISIPLTPATPQEQLEEIALEVEKLLSKFRLKHYLGQFIFTVADDEHGSPYKDEMVQRLLMAVDLLWKEKRSRYAFMVAVVHTDKRPHCHVLFFFQGGVTEKLLNQVKKEACLGDFGRALTVGKKDAPRLVKYLSSTVDGVVLRNCNPDVKEVVVFKKGKEG